MLEVTSIDARGHSLDPRSQSAVWRFGPNMLGHQVDFRVVFSAEGEPSGSRIEARLSYPRPDGARGEAASSVMAALGQVEFSFTFEAYGDLKLTLSSRGETFFEETIPLQA